MYYADAKVAIDHLGRSGMKLDEFNDGFFRAHQVAESRGLSSQQSN